MISKNCCLALVFIQFKLSMAKFFLRGQATVGNANIQGTTRIQTSWMFISAILISINREFYLHWIIFVSAYVEDTLSHSIKELNIPVEVLQKPVSNDVLMNTIEDKEIYDELKRLRLNPEEFKKAGFNHEVLRKILDIFKESKSFVIFCFLTHGYQ